MHLLKNSLINVKENIYIESGLYRVLDIFFESEAICIFKIDSKKASAKPLLLKNKIYLELVSQSLITDVNDAPPLEMLLPDDQITQKNIDIRTESYSLIAELIEDPEFLKSYASTNRSNIVVDHANKMNVKVLVVYRLLVKYWKYGQTLNALLMFTSNYGGRGKEKSSSERQRGRPRNYGKYGLIKKISVNVNEQDKVFIKTAVEEYLKGNKKIIWSKVYDFYIKNYSEVELALAVTENRPAQIVSKSQFRYWVNKFFPKEEVLKKILPDSKFKKDHTGSMSSVSDKNKIPGFRYEIDSTIADVYIVCEVSRERVLGRPTIYAVVDVASRMIAGIHISMEYASWPAARQAIYNAFTSKIEYCNRYDISIEDIDWPCIGIPTQLQGDRAELLGKEAFNTVVNTGCLLQVSPPYRGDLKGVVERRFGILNEEIHFIPGTTLGELRERGEPDYRLDAAITLNAFTKIILELVLEHNTYRTFNSLITRDLIQADLSFTPLQYWNLYSADFRCALRATSKDSLMAQLMKHGIASVTTNGIKFNGRRYICDKAINEGWLTQATNRGHWKIECRYDEAWSTDIFVREEGSSEYLRCKLLDADNVYANLHEADVIFIVEWTKSKKESADLDLNKIARTKRTQALIQSEVKSTKAVSDKLSNNKKIINIREHRRQHLESQKPKFPPSNIHKEIGVTELSNRLNALLLSARDEDE